LRPEEIVTTKRLRSISVTVLRSYLGFLRQLPYK
jgi:hypothetical protein